MSGLVLAFDLDDTLYPERQFALSGFKAAERWAASAPSPPYPSAYPYRCWIWAYHAGWWWTKPLRATASEPLRATASGHYGSGRRNGSPSRTKKLG